MRTEVVSIEDVYPDENNPRKTFDGIRELAESFSLNSERPGEPFTPPLLIRDGGIYRIVDGERRYRALKHLKARSFTANVCESMDEANVMAAMLATDDKQPLSDLERSRGVQQMLLLGVDPEAVDKAANVRCSAKAKRAMAKVKDAAEDMTLDRLIAIADVADDDGAVKRLEECSERDWLRVYDSIKRERQAASDREEIVAALEAEEAVERVVADRGGVDVDELAYDTTLYSVAGAKAHDFAPGTVCLMTTVGSGPAVEVYVPKAVADAEEAERDAERKAVDALKGEIDESEERRMAWVCDRLGEPDRMKRVLDVCEDRLIASYVREIGKMLDLGADLECEPCRAYAALAYAHAAGRSGLSPHARDLLRGKAGVWCEQRVKDAKELASAFLADGYAPEPWERRVFDLIEAVEVDV